VWERAIVDANSNRRTRANGQGTVFKMPNGKWRAEVTLGWNDIKDRDGKVIKRTRIVKTKSGFKLKKDAIAALSELGHNSPGINKSIKVNELYSLWSASHFGRITKPTEYGYVSAYEHCRDLQYRIFTELKTQDLQEAVDKAKTFPRTKEDKPVALGRRAKADIKSLLTNLYKYATENDYCDKNYAQYIKLPPKPKSKKDAFTSKEVDALWKDYKAGNQFTGYILIMIYTGMRFGELAKIEKENIHLPEKYMIGGIKTKAGIDREIPLCDKIIPIVSVFYLAGEKKILEMHEKVFYNKFYETLEKLSIRKLNPHCCRHTAATALADAGIQPAIITAILGHEDYSTTLNYTHIPLEEKIKAVNLI
jgi:integrase